MADKSKFFRVAVEGGTTDGRIIERSWLEEMARTYNPQTYGARVNMEHIKGFSADPPFCAYGDVLGLRTEEIQIEVGGKSEKRLALFAQIDPTEDLVRLNARRQKVYTSIEIEPNFRGTGQCYLMGLAITDNPASLGTEMLQFVAGAPAVKAEFDKRKNSPGNLFSASIETAIEFEAAQAAGQGFDLIAFTKALLGAGQTAQNPAAAGQPQPNPAAQGGDATGFARLEMAMMTFATQFQATRAQDLAEVKALRGDFNALKAQLEATPAPQDRKFTRPAATGGAGVEQTDC